MVESFDLLATAERLGQPMPLMERVVDMGPPSTTSWKGVVPALELGEAEMPDPMVPNGDGQPKGLSVLEQVAWMKMSVHPFIVHDQQLDADLLAAVRFELSHEAAVVDKCGRAGSLDPACRGVAA